MADHEDSALDMLKRLDTSNIISLTEHNRRTANPVFTIDDLKTTHHCLALIMRMLLVACNMSTDEFNSRFNEFNNQDRKTKVTTRNNMKRTIQNRNLTFVSFTDILVYLGFTLVDLSVTVRDARTGDVRTISMEDVRDALKDNAIPEHIVNPKKQGTVSDSSKS